MTTTKSVSTMPINDLKFDRENPRLAEFGIEKGSSEEEIISILWDAMGVMALVQSIAAGGFFPHEQIIVAEEENEQVVIEGNRRLAAVRILLDPKLAGEQRASIPNLSKEKRAALQNLPVILEDRKEAWRYLSFKHINGPANWSSYAKAKYIWHVREQYGIPLTDIATQVGDRHGTVQRLFRSLMVLEQAEDANVYNREDRAQPYFAFSYLCSALKYDGIAKFVSLKDDNWESRTPVPENKLPQLGELCVWLYGCSKENIFPVIQSHSPHLQRLNDVLTNREATAALRKTNRLDIAVETSKLSEIVFEQALLDAKRSLLTTRAYITTGYDESRDVQLIADGVANLANDICDEMERKFTPSKRARRSK